MPLRCSPSRKPLIFCNIIIFIYEYIILCCMKKVISLTLSKDVIMKVSEDSRIQNRSKSQIIDMVLMDHYKIRKRG